MEDMEAVTKQKIATANMKQKGFENKASKSGKEIKTDE